MSALVYLALLAILVLVFLALGINGSIVWLYGVIATVLLYLVYTLTRRR